ncbi:MAG: alcohol dehydrogenase catalytic domain-containing protein [Phototrophicaceae bacterium]
MRTRRRSLLATSLMLHGPQTLSWSEDMLPLVGDNDVVVETIAGAISIGSELPRYLGQSREVKTLLYPMMTGYESYGHITGVGKGVSEQLIGEKIIAFYGHRTHAILPADTLIFTPSRIPPPTALLAILTCDVAKGIRKLNIKPEERVLVTGAGAIGLMTIWMLKRYGVNSIHVLEIDAERCEKALVLGASSAVHPDEAIRWAEDFDIGIECSNNDAGFQILQEKLAHGSRICILSDGNLAPLTLSSHFHHKELSVIASSDGWDYHRHAIWFWQQVKEANILADTLFDMTIPHLELAQTFATLAKGQVNPVKVLINYRNDWS